MSGSTTFTGAGLAFESLTLLSGGTSLRLRWTQDPLQANPAGAHDALNPALYTLTGPQLVLITSIHTVTGDSQAVDLLLGDALTAGTWTLAAAGVQTSAGDNQQAPFSLSLDVETQILITDDVNQGAENDDAERVLRKHLSPAIRGRATNALIAALASGDQKNWDAAALIFDQLFRASASGLYLDRKCADDGVERPTNVGMNDDLYRRLATLVTTNKLTPQVLLEVLEIFYGAEAVRAYTTTAVAEPFTLADGLTLTLLVDEQAEVPISFRSVDFAQILAAKAIEVAAVITRQCQLLGVGAWAQVYPDPETGLNRVRIFSGSLGLRSAIRVTGGLAQNGLRFESPLTTLATTPAVVGVQAGQTWAVSIPRQGVMRLLLSGASQTDLSLVEVDDYLNITGGNFLPENQGCFTVTAVDYRYSGATLVQYVEVENPGASAQSATTSLTTDLMFFRPEKQTINGSRAVIVSQPSPDAVEVVLPATTVAVERDLGQAGYLHEDNGSNDILGPYVLDPGEGLAITSTATVTTQALAARHQYRSLTVADGSQFPDEDGWLVIGFGSSFQAGPVRYFGKVAVNELLLDYSFVFERSCASGASVTLLASKGPYSPSDGVDSLYATASSAGRVAASAHVDSLVAAGVQVQKTVQYPGDRGLGGEGLPAVGAQKLGDKVSIWGGDALDEELVTARGGA
jgi:hypothetical protein